jgi:hypothetical protein
MPSRSAHAVNVHICLKCLVQHGMCAQLVCALEMAFVLLNNNSSSLCKKKHGSYVHTYSANDAEHTYRQEVLCIAVESSQHESVYTTSSSIQVFVFVLL